MQSTLRRGGLHPWSLATLVFLSATSFSPLRGDDPSPAPAAIAPVAQFAGREFNASVWDGSEVRVTVLDSRVRMRTQFGKLIVPVAEIEQIQFATRVSPEVAERVDAAVKALSSPKFSVRQGAMLELFRMEDLAVPGLRMAEQSGDLEAAQRAKDLLGKLEKAIGPERMKVSMDDVVTTKTIRITGMLDTEELRVRTRAFGERVVGVGDFRQMLHRKPADDPVNVRGPEAQPNVDAVKESAEPKPKDPFGAAAEPERAGTAEPKPER